MSARSIPILQDNPSDTVRLIARVPNLRVLAWAGNQLFASRGYRLLRMEVPTRQLCSADVSWCLVADYRASWRRELSSRNRISARLFRDGFHALCVLPSGGLVAAVPGAIITASAGETRFRETHRVVRGTRPLHITAVPGGAVYWGEYFDNPSRAEVHIYSSTDSGGTWTVAYTFSRGEIRHVHNIVYDRWHDCLWILTGDYGNECRILRAACDFSHVDVVLQGNQQARAVALVPAEDGLYFSSDTPLEANHIYRLDRQGNLSELAQISSSSIYGCRVRDRVFFSTMVEPSAVNPDSHVRVYGSDGAEWKSLVAWKKDSWSMRFFQYGNAFLPDGINETDCLAVSTVAVKDGDLVTSLYSIAD